MENVARSCSSYAHWRQGTNFYLFRHRQYRHSTVSDAADFSGIMYRAARVGKPGVALPRWSRCYFRWLSIGMASARLYAQLLRKAFIRTSINRWMACVVLIFRHPAGFNSVQANFSGNAVFGIPIDRHPRHAPASAPELVVPFYGYCLSVRCCDCRHESGEITGSVQTIIHSAFGLEQDRWCAGLYQRA